MKKWIVGTAVGATIAVGAVAVTNVPRLSMLADLAPVITVEGTSQYVPGGWIKFTTGDGEERLLAYIKREDWMPWGYLNDPDLHYVLMADSTWTFHGQPIQRVTPARIGGMWRDDVVTVHTKGGVWADLHRSEWDSIKR